MAQKIDIYIKQQTEEAKRRKKAPEQFDIGARRRGIKPLSRRKETGGLINFWDMGLYWDGLTWRDIPTVYPPIISIRPDNGEPVLSTITPAQSLSFQDLALSTPPSQWDTKFKKIAYEDAEKYGILYYAGDINTDKIYNVARVDRGIERDFTKPNAGRRTTETNWTPQGFQKPDGPAEFIVGSAYHWALTNTGNGYPWSLVKITDQPSFSAPEIPRETFRLAQKADVFLMPQISKFSGVETYAGSPFDFTDSFVGKFATQSRLRLLEKRISGYSDLTWLNTLPLAQSSDAQVAGADKEDFVDYFRSRGVTVFSGSTGGQVSASGFPYHPPATTVTTMNGASYEGGLTNATYGSFLGAIRQSGKTFFFWRADNAEPGYGSSYNPIMIISGLSVALKY